MGDILKYWDEVCRSMQFLGEMPDTVFIGQAVSFPGSAMYKSLGGVPESNRYEMPVCEEMQMGVSLGMSLNGFIPISIFPRWDFLILATNQLVNHLDKFYDMSHGEVSTKVIIRTATGSKKPLYPGVQHSSDHTDIFTQWLQRFEVIKLEKSKDIFSSYQKAYFREDGKSTLLVEVADAYS